MKFSSKCSDVFRILILSDVKVDVHYFINMMKNRYEVEYDIIDKIDIISSLEKKKYNVLITNNQFDLYNNKYLLEYSKGIKLPYLIIEGSSNKDTTLIIGTPYFKISDTLENLVKFINNEFDLDCVKEDNLLEIIKYQRAVEVANSILFEIAKISNRMLTGEFKEKDIYDILGLFGKTLEVSKIYIFEKFEIREKCFYELAFSWTSNIKNFKVNNYVLSIPCSADNSKKLYLHELLEKNEYFVALTKDMESSEFKDFLEREGILSILCIPMTSKLGKLWGFLGIEDCKKERIWNDIEINAMNVAGSILGNIIFKIRENKKINELLDTAMNDTIFFGLQLDRMQLKLNAS